MDKKRGPRVLFTEQLQQGRGFTLAVGAPGRVRIGNFDLGRLTKVRLVPLNSESCRRGKYSLMSKLVQTTLVPY